MMSWWRQRRMHGEIGVLFILRIVSENQQEAAEGAAHMTLGH